MQVCVLDDFRLFFPVLHFLATSPLLQNTRRSASFLVFFASLQMETPKIFPELPCSETPGLLGIKGSTYSTPLFPVVRPFLPDRLGTFSLL